MDAVKMCCLRHRRGGVLALVLVLASVMLVCNARYAGAFEEAPGPAAKGRGQISPEFADALFAEQDYYRAVTEYKRFIYQYPGHPEVGRARLNMARAAMAAQRWEEARYILQHTLEQAPSQELCALVHMLLAEIPYRQGAFGASFDYLDELEEPHSASPFAQRARQLQLWSLLEGEHLQRAQQFLGAQTVELCPDLEDVARLQELPRKSPRLAGALSALVPGAGQLYNARYREAGMAFALNAAFVAGGVEAINNGNTVLGAILLFFEAGWYGGNIYNAVNTAHKTNRRRYRSRLEELRSRCRFSLLSDERGAILQLRTRF